MSNQKTSIFSINKIIFFFLNKTEKKKFAVFTIFSLLSLLLEALGIGIFLPILAILNGGEDQFINYPTFNKILNYLNLDNQQKIFIFLILSFTIVFVLKNILLVFINFWQIRFGNELRLRLSNEFFENYLNQNTSFFMQRDKTVISRYVISETNNVREIIINLGNIYSEILVIIFLVGCMLYFNSLVIIFLMLFIIFLAFTFDKITKKKLRIAGQERIIQSNKFVKILMNSFRSIRDLKLYEKEKYSISSFNESNIKFSNLSNRYSYINILPRFFFESIAIVFFCILCIFAMNNNQDFTQVFAQLSLLFLITIRIMRSINKVTTAITGLRYVSPASVKLFNEFNDISRNLYQKEKLKKNYIKSFQNKIEISNLSFSYSNKEILTNASIEIKKGEKIALIGSSGSGKSTFMDLLVGFLNPREGLIEIDGSKYSFNEIFRFNLFGYVHQNVILFNDTILNNITMNDPNMNNTANLEKIYDYCKKAQIYDFIMSLPNKINTIVGEDGLKVSGGQKQRIGIVRALLSDPDILILDEATNSLDPETEKNFFDILKNFNKKLTILSINHKIVNENFFDKIYNLKDKKIVKI